MIVLDCSAGIEIARNTDLGRAFKGLMLGGEKVISSELFKAEAANVFWKYANAQLMDADTAQRYVSQTLGLVDEFHGFDDFIAEVLAEATRTGHPAYDLFYVVLTRRNAATLFTADRKLADVCLKLGVSCTELDREF